MKIKRLISTSLAVMLTGITIFLPCFGFTSEAKMNSSINITNSSLVTTDFVVQTPQSTVNAVSGMTWEEKSMGFINRLDVKDSGCGPNAQKVLDETAKKYGATIQNKLDVTLYRQLNGFTKRSYFTNEPIQLCMNAPANNGDIDFAVIEICCDASAKVLPDLDQSADTITVKADQFLVFAIVSAPKGAFKAVKTLTESKGCANRLEAIVKATPYGSIGTNATISSTSDMVEKFGIGTDAAATKAALGITPSQTWLSPVFSLTAPVCGPMAQKAMDAAVNSTKCQGSYLLNFTASKEGDGCYEAVTKSSSPINFTMAVPKSFPMYADYAVVILKDNGSAYIQKDLDNNASTISFQCSDFRMISFIYGPFGAFNSYK